jgi:sulfate adenylyltransferase
MKSGVALNRRQYLELEKLGLEVFAPLGGFMTEGEFATVVDRMRLPGGQLFPLPVLLDVPRPVADRLSLDRTVPLTCDGESVGELQVQSLFTCDRPAVARRLYGTDDPRHPGVAHFLKMADVFVGGPVRLRQRLTCEFSSEEWTPQQTKALFAERGWRSVVGFQTRNVPHRAHEHLLRLALELADGLFVQPLVGRKKRGDYTPEAILTGYRRFIREFLPADRVLLGVLSTTMRYAGPREAVFHAIIRRNYGCTHFIVGRDHAGVGEYYAKYEAQEMALHLNGELGIQILGFAGPYQCDRCGGIVTERSCPHAGTPAVTEVSGSEIRRRLSGGESCRAEWIRPEVLESVREVPLFITEDEA